MNAKETTNASLHSLFSFQLAQVDASKHIEFLRGQFAAQDASFMDMSRSPGFRTTLRNYSVTETSTFSLADGEQTERFLALLKDAAQAFAQVSGYAVDKYNIHVRNVWLNEMKSGSFHGKHSHYGNHFSGIVYVDVPQDAPGIVFESLLARVEKAPIELATITPCNANNITFPAVEGSMYIWESWMPHEVPVGTFEGVRRSVAFDIVFEPI